jgi:hypothetical protein
VVGSGADCADDLFGFGCGKNELDVGGWLFNNFEQSVETLSGNHVRFIEDEDLETVAGWCKNGALAQVSGIVNTVVAGRVDLDYI